MSNLEDRGSSQKTREGAILPKKLSVDMRGYRTRQDGIKSSGFTNPTTAFKDNGSTQYDNMEPA